MHFVLHTPNRSDNAHACYYLLYNYEFVYTNKYFYKFIYLGSIQYRHKLVQLLYTFSALKFYFVIIFLKKNEKRNRNPFKTNCTVSGEFRNHKKKSFRISISRSITRCMQFIVTQYMCSNRILFQCLVKRLPDNKTFSILFQKILSAVYT